MIIKHGRHLFDKFTRRAKVCGLFVLGSDWLGKKTPITWAE